MTLSLYDTMAREKREFVPRDENRVTMYVCGPTVYNYSHIGNFRPVVVFDVLFRLLRRCYGPEAVIYAANVTDVDDKINAKAAAEGVPIGEISERYLAAYNADMAALGALPPTLQPKVTETMDCIQDMIRRLVKRHAAYAAEGHVLFDTQAFADYGALSGHPMEDMIAGARVDVAPYKRHPADFVLWKPSKPGEPAWESPWGDGRPGWHIECSAMIDEALGLPIDIHGGGVDLIFPHHENEMAQGLCAGHAKEYARYWVHNGFLNFGDEKMSKSLGNVALAHDLLKQAPGEVLRWALLVGHYRAPLEWTGDLIEQSRRSLDRIYRTLSDLKREAANAGVELPEGDERTAEALLDESGLTAALEDDLNTPLALSSLFALANGLRSAISNGRTTDWQEAADVRAALLEGGQLLGVLTSDPEAWFQGAADEDLKARIEALVLARTAARKAKDFAEADRIRDELTALNVEVMDGPAGATLADQGADLMAGAPDFYNRRKGFEFGRGKETGGPSGVKIEHRIGVQAPAAVVWEIIHDLARWPEWNPIYPKASGTVRIGETLTLTRALPGQPHKVIQPVVLDWTPNELLHVKLSLMRGLASVTSYWEVDALAEASCIFSSGELYTGWLGPSTARAIRGSLRRGFTAEGEAMKVRAEAAWRAQGGAPTSAP